jgi:hypothetical protein
MKRGCPVLSYLVLSCLILPCPVLSCLVLRFLALPVQIDMEKATPKVVFSVFSSQNGAPESMKNELSYGTCCNLRGFGKARLGMRCGDLKRPAGLTQGTSWDPNRCARKAGGTKEGAKATPGQPKSPPGDQKWIPGLESELSEVRSDSSVSPWGGCCG